GAARSAGLRCCGGARARRAVTRVEPAAALVGDIAVPAVKGICQRGALLAAIAEGESELRNFGHAADTDAALEAVQALGADVNEPVQGTVRIGGRGPRGVVPPPAADEWGDARPGPRLLGGVPGGRGGGV